ncbi:MAG: hypothetical protein H0U67_01160 [Gemmatimonadetes bacterium]|nr:hypothetical protein [Gemmatimonadota bacterium]
MRKYRGGRWDSDLGEFYVVNVNSNFITAAHVSPEAWGREVGVLKEWEQLAGEG